MDEFSLIDAFFASIGHSRHDVVFGIGDDAACLRVPPGKDLLVSSDTLVSGVHFLPSWDAYDIACKAVRVNVSDMAAMGASPCWLMLALTLPTLDEPWLQRFSEGLRDSLAYFDMALIGGDTTRGPLSMTMTIHGVIDEGKAVRRSGANAGDTIYVTGALGAAACALKQRDRCDLDARDRAVLEKKLHTPEPRLDFNDCLQAYASSAIDVSDGLCADLQHIGTKSGVGACLFLDNIPVHPLVEKYQGENALAFALRGGDDYELCFTIPPHHEDAFLRTLAASGLMAYPIGMIESATGLRAKNVCGDVVPLSAKGYCHF